MKIKESRVLKSEDFLKIFATEQIPQQKPMTQQSTSQSDNPAHARNWVLEEIVSQLKKTKFKREVNMTMQSADRGKNASQVVKEASTYNLKGNNSNPATVASVEGNGAASFLTPQSKLQEGLGTASDYNAGEPPLPSTSSNSGDDNKLLTILIVLVGIVIVLILTAIIMTLKKQSGRFPGSSCTVTCCVKNIYFIDGDEYRPFIRDTFQTGEAAKYNLTITNKFRLFNSTGPK